MEEKEDVTIIGKTNFRDEVKFGIKLNDRRRHIYMLGKTGTGKSTLMENMIIDDIRSGKGVGLIDPHGDFAERLLDYIPEERIDDVVYFNPADTAYPIGFNPMEQVKDEHRYLVASSMMAVFRKVWADVWSNRMQYILNNTLLALLEDPGTTIVDVMRMLTNKKYRDKIVAELKDPVVKAFWVDEFANWSQRYADDANAAVLNKVGQLVANPLVRHIIGQAHSTINVREIMDGGKIFIANLSKGKMGEDNSALLGSMLITKIQMAAMSRVDIPNEEDRKDFFLYIDEFQNFSTDSFADILSEARKYRLSMVLGHQYIKQLFDPITKNFKIRDAIFGNVGTIIVFRVGAEDAEFLEKEFEPEFLINDLVNLPNFNVYVKLMINSTTSKPFSAATLSTTMLERVGQSAAIIENSRNKYGLPLEEVKAKITANYEASLQGVEERIKRRGEQGLRMLADQKSKEQKREKPKIDKEKLQEALKETLENGPGDK